jgi:HSP20 family protein
VALGLAKYEYMAGASRREALMELRFENGGFPNGLTGNSWLFDRMNGMLKEYNGAARRITPQADVVEDKDGYHFYFEMPGLKSESLDVRIENDALVVSAERKRPEWAKESRVHVAERGYGAIRRAFELPEDASRDNINASYKDGVLAVKIEKRPESKPVKISIN